MYGSIINNFVDEKDCSLMIDHLESLITIGDVVIREDGRISVANRNDEVFLNLVEKYKNKTTEIFNDEFNKVGGYLLTKYIAGVGMNLHTDSNKDEEVGVLMYLNDDYQGGELIYTDSDGNDHLIKAKRGDMVYCPSWYLHGVNKVISGNRYFFTISLIK